MFCAFEVIASPQTHESAPSFGATHSTGTPSSTIACGRAAAAVGEHDLARLEQVDHRGVRLGEGAEVVAVVEQVLLCLLDLLVA